MTNKLTILGVDDKQNIPTDLKRLICKENHATLTASISKISLSLLETHSVRLKTSKLRVSEMNDIEFLKTVKSILIFFLESLTAKRFIITIDSL